MSEIEILDFTGFDIYQAEAQKTAIYPIESAVYYLTLGLCGEVGEVAEKVKKNIRDGKIIEYDDIRKELGDVLWYLANLAREFDITLQDVAYTNIEKLRDRQKRNKLSGSGDNR